jgi:hypothetical protein
MTYVMKIIFVELGRHVALWVKLIYPVWYERNVIKRVAARSDMKWIKTEYNS